MLLPRSTLFPYTTLFRSPAPGQFGKHLVRPRPEKHQEGQGVEPEVGGLFNEPLARFLPGGPGHLGRLFHDLLDRKSTRLNSSHTVISYAVFCLKKKKNKQ